MEDLNKNVQKSYLYHKFLFTAHSKLLANTGTAHCRLTNELTFFNLTPKMIWGMKLGPWYMKKGKIKIQQCPLFWENSFMCRGY